MSPRFRHLVEQDWNRRIRRTETPELLRRQKVKQAHECGDACGVDSGMKEIHAGSMTRAVNHRQ